jgi:dTDP-4-dehydrorhamnose reductase
VLIAVTGAGGMLGRAVAAAARAAGHDVLALTHGDLDVTDEAAVGAAIGSARPGALVNCAAWTDVDGAEEHEPEATQVNGAAAGNLARAAAAAGARIVHVSTDYVFAGDAREPYVESSPVGPRSAYGRSKLAGERAVTQAGGDHAIVRTAWLFGEGGHNFVDTMLTLGSERDELRVVDDQIGCPTWTGHLAPALVRAAEGGPPGVYHAAGAGRCSWFDLARAAIDGAALRCSVVPATTAEFPRPAPRPAFSVLASERGDDALNLPPWEQGLAAFLAARATTEVTT